MLTLLAIAIREIPEQVAHVKKNPTQNTLILHILGAVLVLLMIFLVFFRKLPSSLSSFTVASNIEMMKDRDSILKVIQQ